MAKWHLIKNQPVLRETFKDPPILSYSKGRLLKDILARAKLWGSTIAPMDQWESCLACLFYSPSNNVIFVWGTAEHSLSSISGSNCNKKVRLPIQAWFLSSSRKWSPKYFCLRRSHCNSLVVRRVSSGGMTFVLFWTKYAVSRQMRPEFSNL